MAARKKADARLRRGRPLPSGPVSSPSSSTRRTPPRRRSRRRVSATTRSASPRRPPTRSARRPPCRRRRSTPQTRRPMPGRSTPRRPTRPRFRCSRPWPRRSRSRRLGATRSARARGGWRADSTSLLCPTIRARAGRRSACSPCSRWRLAALVLPGAASALVSPSIQHPPNGTRCSAAGARTITFSCRGRQRRGGVHAPACRAVGRRVRRRRAPAAASTVPGGATASGAAPLAPAPLVDSDSIADGDWCYWVESTDGLSTADSAPVKITLDTTPPTVTITSATAAELHAVDERELRVLGQRRHPGVPARRERVRLVHVVLDDELLGALGGSAHVHGAVDRWCGERRQRQLLVDGGPHEPGRDDLAREASRRASRTPRAPTSCSPTNEGTPQCKLDGGSFGSCSSSTTMNYSGLSQTSHTFTVRSTDAAGNTGSDAYTWTVDTTAPTVPANLTPGRPVLAQHAAVVHVRNVHRPSRAADIPPLPRRHVHRAHGLERLDRRLHDRRGRLERRDLQLHRARGRRRRQRELLVLQRRGDDGLRAAVGARQRPAAANPTRLVPVISWNASTGVPVAYQVLRNGSLIGTVERAGHRVRRRVRHG